MEKLPNNILIVQTAPQLMLLKHAKLFITHGGLGSIKEAVLNGVPMLVIPFETDGPRNAERILYHKLGRHCALSECTPGRIKQLTLDMLESDDMRDHLFRMQNIFCDYENRASSVRFIEQTMSVHA
jgi:UDP:flavonoid glycosyltransferase YjiC (YdhE family)